MLTALFSLFEGRMGSSIFLFAILLCFVYIYIIMTSDVAERYRSKRFGVLVAATVLTDGVWLFYTYSSIIELWEGTNVDKLFFQFGAAGMIFFAAFIYTGMTGAGPKKVLKGTLLSVYISCLLLAFFGCFATEFLFGVQMNVRAVIIGIELFLNIVMISIVYIIGFVFVPHEDVSHQKKLLAAGLGIITGVMTLLFIYISLKDMGVLDLIIKR